MGKFFQWISVKKNQKTLMFIVMFTGAALSIYLNYKKEAGTASPEANAIGSNSVLPNTPKVNKDEATDLGGTDSHQSSKSSGNGISINADRGASVNINK